MQQREIKFRAWDGNKFLYSDRNEFYLMPTCVQIPSSTGYDFYDKDYPVTQYTGLKDKSDKDIYEGDILSMWLENYDNPIENDYKHEVVFKDGAFGYNSRAFKEFHAFASHPVVTKPVIDNALIVGNIYQNPELLNK